MIIGFLADKIPYHAKRGWGIYSYQLLKALINSDPDNTYRCYYNYFRRGRQDLVLNINRPNIENITWRLPGRLMDLMWERWGILSAENVLGKIDILHVPYEFLPRVRSAKTVVTVHDVTFLKHPEYLDPGFVKLYTARIRNVVNRADMIIAVSDNTRRELISLAGAKESRIRVVMLAADEKFRMVKDNALIAEVGRRYGAGSNYILYVGAADDDKNLVRLAEAFARVRKDHSDVRLVLAGMAGWGFERLTARLSSMNLSEGVVIAGFVSDADLPVLYSGARLLAIPSIHEGFGLPVLEAMACGTPVLCSNTSSLPEVAGDAGVQVDPYSVESIEKGIRNLLEDKSLAGKCRKDGLERARQFSWEKTAKQVISIYKELAQ